MRCTALALKQATASSPTFSRRSSSDCLVMSATRGKPQSTTTRTCPPRGVMRVTLPGR